MKRWQCLFEELNLSTGERRASKAFFTKPEGLRFLPLVAILKSRKMPVEAVELLSWGLRRSPHYTPARVMLGRELYLLGLIAAAWDTLRPLLAEQLDNFTAYKTAFCCALLHGDRRQSYSLAKKLEEINRYDHEVKTLLHTLIIEGFERTQQLLRAQLAQQSISPLLAPGVELQYVEIKETPVVPKLVVPKLAPRVQPKPAAQQVAKVEAPVAVKVELPIAANLELPAATKVKPPLAAKVEPSVVAKQKPLVTTVEQKVAVVQKQIAAKRTGTLQMVPLSEVWDFCSD
jgi:hypothetical protein